MTYDNSCRNNLSEVKVEIKEDAVSYQGQLRAKLEFQKISQIIAINVTGN